MWSQGCLPISDKETDGFRDICYMPCGCTFVKQGASYYYVIRLNRLLLVVWDVLMLKSICALQSQTSVFQKDNVTTVVLLKANKISSATTSHLPWLQMLQTGRPVSLLLGQEWWCDTASCLVLCSLDALLAGWSWHPDFVGWSHIPLAQYLHHRHPWTTVRMKDSLVFPLSKLVWLRQLLRGDAITVSLEQPHNWPGRVRPVVTVQGILAQRRTKTLLTVGGGSGV